MLVISQVRMAPLLLTMFERIPLGIHRFGQVVRAGKRRGPNQLSVVVGGGGVCRVSVILGIVQDDSQVCSKCSNTGRENKLNQVQHSSILFWMRIQ